MVSWTTPHEHAQWLRQGTAGVEVQPCPAMDAVRAYLDRPTLDWVIILASRKVGTGKSFAAAWLKTRLVELSETRQDVTQADAKGWGTPFMWCSCGALGGLRALKPWDREDQLNELARAWGLVLDDIGTEHDPGVVAGLLAERHASGLLTICTTNLTDAEGQPTEEWRSRYGGRISSRLKVAGDYERGSRQAWCYCATDDMRGRVQPQLRAATSSPPTLDVDIDDIDALAGPLLAEMKPPHQHAVPETRAESRVLADAVQRKVWGGVALKVLGERAAEDDPVACDVLDEIARRVRA